jgi:hypothetical protein
LILEMYLTQSFVSPRPPPRMRYLAYANPALVSGMAFDRGA